MRKINSILFRTVLFFLAVAASVSCLNEKEGPVASQQSVMVELNVSVGAMTKSALTPEEETLNTLRVYAFHGERLAGYVGWLESMPTDKMYMNLTLPESGAYDLTFYAIANEGQMSYGQGVVEVSENMTKAQLEAIRFTGLESEDSLPMYYKGVHTINAGNVLDEMLADKVELKLGRSLAKISVYAASATEGVTQQVHSLTLLAGGTRNYSYLFPQGEETLQGLSSTVYDMNLLSSTVTVSKSVISGSAAAEFSENYNPVCIGKYLPEVPYGSESWNVDSGNDKAPVLHVEYSAGEGQQLKHGYVYLPKILRNTHYKVCILIRSEGQIIVNFIVAPWIEAEDNYRDIDYPTHSYLMSEVAVAGEEAPAAPSSKAVMSEANPFIGYFQMTYPSSEKWTPTLEGKYAGESDVEVYEYQVSGIYKESDKLSFPIPASDKWYTIMVVPHNDMPVSETVNLAVTYVGGGFSAAEYLLINGSAQKYYWPESEDCNYVTITMVN
jgi:hypothetical protein